MDLLNIIQKRYSCRSYEKEAVPAELLNAILESARLAPSARNIQDWRFVVVTDRDKRQQLAEAANQQSFIAQAPVVIACCSISSYQMRCGQPIAPVDVAIAMEHMVLMAASLNLATCWVGAFYPDQVRAILDIPSHVSVVELLTLGFPASKQPEINRLPIEMIVCREKWSF